MRPLQSLSNGTTRHYECGPILKGLTKVDEAVEKSISDQGLVLGLHVPAAIGADIPARLYLN